MADHSVGRDAGGRSRPTLRITGTELEHGAGTDATLYDAHYVPAGSATARGSQL